MNSKRIFAAMLVGISIAANVAAVSAQGTPAPSGPAAAPSCARITEFSSKIISGMSDRDAKFDASYADRLEKIKALEEEQDRRLDKRRENQQDANRADRYAKLDAKAVTDAQKAAVAAFKTTIEAAVTTRRSTVDSAVAAFRAGIRSVMDDRKSTVDSFITTLRSSVAAAVDKAKADCAAGVEPKTVRETLRTSLKAALEKFQADRKTLEKFHTTIEALRATRHTAIKAAVDAFKEVARKAMQDLKAAFPEPTTSGAGS